MRVWKSPSLSLSIAASAVLVAWPLSSLGACVVTAISGGQRYVCTSGTDPGINPPPGNNEVLLPSGNPVVNGNVALGAGNDLFQMDAVAARINGAVNMGDGVNQFFMREGTITGAVTQGAGGDNAQISGGTAGAMSQGAGIDTFAMSGGTLASLAQGDGRDFFNMSGGTITGAFEDGDTATMSGGSIGRVDMKLDNNSFLMSGGTIIGNLVTGFGIDTIEVSDKAFIGGNISTSGGADSITVTGGVVNGQILASAGDDHFSWIGGGAIRGFILLGADNDTALVQNLNESILSSTPVLDGGLGTDTLTFDNTQAETPGRYTNFEQVLVQNGSSLKLGGTFTLGDSASGTGSMNIDGASKLLVDTGVISPFTVGLLTTVKNAGLIDMTASTSTTTLTINGNYTGAGGTLALKTFLGTDGAASDKLVVNQGKIDGTTAISIKNLNGPGGLTTQDGIQVVQATNGATSSAGAFTLANSVSAGAFDYYLFKGGVTAGTADNFYLRSTVPVVPPPPPDPVIVIPLPTPVPDTPPLPPNPVITPIPIYRPEVALYSVLFPAAQQIVQAMLGTYHERVGDQRQQQPTGVFPAGWGRVYGSSSRQGFEGTVNPTLRSSMTAFQAGTHVYASTLDNGAVQRAGFFVGHSRLTGDVKGFNGGWQNKDAGSTKLRGDSLGVYWTLIGANQAYLDVVLMGTRFNGHTESDRGVKANTRGHNVAASAEVGWPVQVTPAVVVEPQAQLIVSKTSLDSHNDGISKISYDADTSVTTRLGVRLRGDYQVRGLPLQPYARANVWHTRGGKNTVTFADVTDIVTEQKSTTLGLSVGANLAVAPGISLYGEVGYNRNLDSNTFNGRQGTVGVQVTF